MTKKQNKKEIKKQNKKVPEMIEVLDIDNKKIKVPKESCLYYTNEKDNKNYSLRVDFLETFGNVENYLLTGYEPININEFDKDFLIKDNFNGKFILKMILKDKTIINHYYSFIGYESKNILKLVPVKIPLKNKYSVNPTDILSMNWYYLESNHNMEYIDLIELLKDDKE